MALLLKLWRFCRRWVLVGALLIWLVLFYCNYWQANIPAFGDPAVHLATLRQIFTRYVAVGLALGSALALVLRLDHTSRINQKSVQREQGVSTTLGRS